MGIFAPCSSGRRSVVLGAEWPRLSAVLGADAAQCVPQAPQGELTVIEGEGDDDFAASVQRDLESLPVIEEHDDRTRR